MKKPITLLAFTLLFFTLSCSNDKETLFLKLLAETPELPKGSMVEQYNYVIIPGSGCSSCISMARRMIKEGSYAENTFFIFTGFETRKQLKILYGADFIDGKNIYLDHNDAFKTGALFSLYPTVIRMSSGFQLTDASTGNKWIWDELNEGE